MKSGQGTEPTSAIVIIAVPSGVVTGEAPDASVTVTVQLEAWFTNTLSQVTLVEVGRRITVTEVVADELEWPLETVQSKPKKVVAVTMYEPGAFGPEILSTMLNVSPAVFSGLNDPEPRKVKHAEPGDVDTTVQGELGEIIAVTSKGVPQVPEKVTDTEAAIWELGQLPGPDGAQVVDTPIVKVGVVLVNIVDGLKLENVIGTRLWACANGIKAEPAMATANMITKNVVNRNFP